MMTNETEAPKRIWAQDAEPRECNFIGGGWWDDSLGSTQYAHIVEYIRKDLCDAKDKRIEELEAELATALAGLQEISDYEFTVTRHWNGPSPEDEVDATVPKIEAEYMQEIAFNASQN
jgi:hypothetical protein